MFTMTYSPINDITGLKKVNLFCIRDPIKVAAMLRSLDQTSTLSIVESIHCFIQIINHSNCVSKIENCIGRVFSTMPLPVGVTKKVQAKITAGSVVNVKSQ